MRVKALLVVLALSGCVSSSVGGYTKDGKPDRTWCLGNCIERSANGDACVRFTAEVAGICADFLGTK